MRERFIGWILLVFERILLAYIHSRPGLRESLDQEMIERFQKIHRRGRPLHLDLMTTGEERV